MGLRFKAVAAGVLAPAALALGAQQAAAATTFYLDSHKEQAPGDNYAGPSSDLQVLINTPQVRLYRVTVQGTVSVWRTTSWLNPRYKVCGTPLLAPSIASPGVDNGKVGLDARGRFAVVQASNSTCPTLPDTVGQNLQFSTTGPGPGGNWAYYAPDMSQSNPATHTYVYTIPGAGQPLSARFFDPDASDNYGVFSINVSLLGLV